MWYENARLVDCGIDYFTTTATDPPTAKVLLVQAEGLIFQEEQSGYFTKPWRMKGYSGWKCGRVEHGWREEGAIVRLSSSRAASHWWELYETTGRCSRIDLQATYRLPGSPKDAVFDMHQEARRYYLGTNYGPKITIWSDNREGATLYLGCRQSQLYFRAYNKAAESLDDCWSNCVRLELEVKGRLTQSIIAYLVSAEFVGAGVLSLLSQYISNRGISSNIPTGLPGSFYEPSTLATDELKSLEWLRSAVGPSVELLCSRGLLTEVLESLRLSKLIPECKGTCDSL